MTQEQKAKAYDEAIKRAKSAIKYPDKPCFVKVDEIFPELKESEDEKIRKELVEFIKKRDRSGCDYDYDKWIAWLEKQTNAKVKDFSENREDLSEFYKQVCHMAALLLNKEYDYTMETIEWCAYTLLKYAKKELEKQGEQILANSTKTCKNEQKPTWSEEDEKCLENAIMYCEWARDKAPDLPCYETSEKSISWLKSLKDRYTWKPSDEQMIEEYGAAVKSLYQDLKKLRGKQ